MTKEERKQYMKQYMKQYNKEYYTKHKEERKEYMKQYYKGYYEKHKEERKENMKQYSKEYYMKHKDERKQYSKEYYIKHKEERERKKKSKSITYYVLKAPGKKDLKFKKRRNAQLHSFIYHSDYPTYSIYKINIVTKEELVESGENSVMNDKEETTVLNNKNIFKFFNKKEEPKYQKEVNQIRAGLEKLGTVSCTDAELGQVWRDFSDECYCASFLIPDDESIRHFAKWLDRDNANDDEEEE